MYRDSPILDLEHPLDGRTVKSFQSIEEGPFKRSWWLHLRAIVLNRSLLQATFKVGLAILV